jgi:flagellar biosynthetic protein FliR
MDIGAIGDKVIYGAMTMLRLAPMFFANTMTPMSRMPQLARVIMMLAFSLIIVASIPSDLSWQSLSAIELAFIAVSELTLGFILLFGLVAAQSAIMTLGRMVEMQIGFGAAGIIDPRTNQSESLIGTLLTMVAILLMFTLNIHHDLIASFWLSFMASPTGVLIYPNVLELVVPTLSAQFLLALLLVLPVSLSIFILDLIIGFLAKTMPQMNIYFVSLPLKIAVGLMVFSLSAETMASLFRSIFEQVSNFWLMLIGV